MEIPVEAMAALLDGLEGEPRCAREALVHDLVDSGHSLEDLVKANAVDQLALLPVTDALRDEGSFTISEIARRNGVEVEQLRRARRAAGLAVSDEAVYGERVERYAAQLQAALEAGLSLDAVVTFNYVLGGAAHSIAGAARDSIRGMLNGMDPGGSERSRALRAAELVMVMQPIFSDVVVNVLEEHVQQLARREVTASLTAGDAAPSTAMTVGFADVVGFTALGDTATTAALSSVAQGLEAATRDALQGDAQLVKTLGDAVMVCAASTDDVLHTFLALSDQAARAGLPALRIGLAHGLAISRAGDWFGSVVNRASRLTALAAPGGILVDEDVRRCVAAAGAISWRDEGQLPIRGLSAPLHCWSVNRTNGRA